MSEPDVYLRKFQKELSAGTVSLALLAVLAQADEPFTAISSPNGWSGWKACSAASRAPCIRYCAIWKGQGCCRVISSHLHPGRRAVITALPTAGETACANGPPPGAPPVIPLTQSCRGPTYEHDCAVTSVADHHFRLLGAAAVGAGGRRTGDDPGCALRRRRISARRACGTATARARRRSLQAWLPATARRRKWPRSTAKPK